jgi:hypothetical protein
MALESFGLPMVGPPGIAKDRLDMLRTAFATMANDKAYQADALRVDMPVGAALDGATVAAMMNDLAAMATADVVAQYRHLISGR